MTVDDTTLVFDPHDQATVRDPHALFRRMRDEAPLYVDTERGFVALSRYEDVERALVDRSTFISGRGVTLGLLKAGITLPPGTVLMEDPPGHTIHRRLLSRMFTQRHLAQVESRTRQYTVELLDPLVGSGGFDFVQDVGRHVPSRVISFLIGIPDQDRDEISEHLNRGDDEGLPDEDFFSSEMFADYIDWRVEHPSDDIMSQLLHAEFEDETGETRRLTRTELLAYVNIVALAGNHTTRLLISWIGKLLSDHPDQRRRLVEDRSLVPNAVEEAMRLEGPTGTAGRYVAQDVELYGQVVPEGSHMALLTLSANHDDRRFEDPDRFDVGREIAQHLTLGFGAHYCLGQALARQEARVVLEEVLARFPDWTVDDDASVFQVGDIELRGWDRLPVTIP
jgi:cytochrome P450